MKKVMMGMILLAGILILSNNKTNAEMEANYLFTANCVGDNGNFKSCDEYGHMATCMKLKPCE